MPSFDANVSEYQYEGYTIFRNVLDHGLIEETRDHIDWLLRKHPDKRPEQLTHDLITHDAFWVRLISDRRLVDIADAFLGPNVALFASHYICKPPGTGQPVLWHQDGGYWPLEPMEVITLWLAVDRSDPGNGCMRVIPRTQQVDLQEVQSRSDVESVLGSSIDESLVDESAAVDVILEPGDVSVHHPNVIHGSNANTSDRWRRGLTIRYIPTSTRILGESAVSEPEAARGSGSPGFRFPSAFMLRGSARPGINRFNPWPAFSGEHSMPFAGCGTWNDEAARHNGRYADVIG